VVALRIAIFDDVVAARGETFHIPGCEVVVHPHADNAAAELCGADGGVGTAPPDVVFMDYALGPGRTSGADAIRALRAAGYRGRIVGISSDPAANAEMRAAGADDSLAKKAHLRSYLVHLGGRHLDGQPPFRRRRAPSGT
jgi:DNA-binding NarL/FixJ family response regulator